MKIVIYGIKSSGKIIAEILKENSNYDIVGFIGNKEEKKKLKGKKIFLDLPFLGDEELIPKLILNGIDGFIIGVGNINLKEEIFYKFEKKGLKPVSAISKYAKIFPGTKIGKGSTIGNSCIISSNVKIGNNTFVGTNSIIEIGVEISNNCKVGSNVFIGADAKIGKNVNIGVSSTILTNCKVGKNNYLSPRTLISKNINSKLR